MNQEGWWAISDCLLLMCYTRIGLAETEEKHKKASILIVGSWW